ncbi:MAG: hypothetical protein V9G12_04330 [Microthrixaceae bacterium]
MGETLTIGHRFCGPPTSGNGGWVSGSLAGFVDGPPEITLRRPPPLGIPLEVVHGDDGEVRLMDAAEVVAEARAAGRRRRDRVAAARHPRRGPGGREALRRSSPPHVSNMLGLRHGP